MIPGGMSDLAIPDDPHLPECLLPDFDKGEWVCICHLLRACEQRVLASCAMKDRNLHAEGYAAALDAAREAVAAVPDDMNSSAEWERDYDMDESGQTRNPRIWVREALAAIDALREEQRKAPAQ